MKAFETAGFGESPNYSGFSREVWEVRNFTEYRQSAFESRNAQSAMLRDQIKHKKGVRYSELLRLPYLDIVRCHYNNRPNAQSVSRHSQKGVTPVESYGLLTTADFNTIQQQVNSINVPPL